jgi:cytochrome P450
VLRETLRLDAPVPNAMRTAVGADALPLSAPLTDKRGVVHASVPIVPGDGVAIPIRLVNTSEALWGPDAKTWKYVARPSFSRCRRG